MKKLTGQHHFSFAAATAITVTLLSTNMIAAAIDKYPPLTHVTHGNACRPMSNSSGTAQVATDGTSNTNTLSNLRVSCPVTTPETGFDWSNDFFAVDVMDGSPGQAVTARSCWTARSFLGSSCSSSSGTYHINTGTSSLWLPIPDAPWDVAYSIEVVLPKLSSWGSQVRSYGYYHDSDYATDDDLDDVEEDVSSLQSDVSTLYGADSSHDSSISSLQSADSSHDTSISNLESRVSELENDNAVF